MSSGRVKGKQRRKELARQSPSVIAGACGQRCALWLWLPLQESTREALGLRLSGAVVIVDEAHNLIDTLNEMHSITLSARQLSEARALSKIHALTRDVSWREALQDVLRLRESALRGLI